MSDRLLSIVLPVYNQADHIEGIVRDYVQALAKIPEAHELILVVNGCRDESMNICSRLDEEFEVVRAIETEGRGWGYAVQCGIKEARGDTICYTNSARTSAADLSLMLLYAVVNDGVIIKAHRKIRESFRRRLGSLFYNLEARALFDIGLWDINGTPKIFSRDLAPLMELREEGDLIDLEFCRIVTEEKFQVLEVPLVSAQPRRGGKSTTNLKSAFGMYLGALRMSREQKARKAE